MMRISQRFPPKSNKDDLLRLAAVGLFAVRRKCCLVHYNHVEGFPLPSFSHISFSTSPRSLLCSLLQATTSTPPMTFVLHTNDVQLGDASALDYVIFRAPAPTVGGTTHFLGQYAVCSILYAHTHTILFFVSCIFLFSRMLVLGAISASKPALVLLLVGMWSSQVVLVKVDKAISLSH